jgi:dTMP kinase
MTWYVLDGMDGSGKTTTAYALKEILESRGRSVLMITHPDRERFFGELSAECLLKEGKPAKIFTTIFFVFNIFGSLIRLKSTDKDDVIFVRYTMSVCYLPEKHVLAAYRVLTAILPKPDVLIYKDVEEETALGRIDERGEKREMFENIESLKDTRKKMRMISDDWNIINAEDTPEEVADRLRTLIRD